MKTGLWSCIKDMFEPHLAEISNSKELQGLDFYSLAVPTFSMELLMMLLISLLFKWSGGKRVIVLVDEYDTPLNSAFQNGFYDAASRFFSRFFSSALKDNKHFEKACLAGIVEARGAHILSTMNNICIYSVSGTRFSAHFGFTMEEIQDIVDSKETLRNVLGRYNGYTNCNTIGTTTVINPWSFLSFMHFGEFRSYWIDTLGTAFTATIRLILEPYIKNLLLTTFLLLFDPDPVRVPSLCSEFDYSSKSRTVVSILYFLVHTGYLSYCA